MSKSVKKKAVKAKAKKPIKKARVASPKKAGRPAHVPTPELRDQVSSLVGYGMTRAQVSSIMHMDANTLRKHYAVELETGDLRANAAVARTLFKQAVGAPAEYDNKGNRVREEVLPHPGCGMFWAKTRMGWCEVPREHRFGGSADAPPIQQVAVVGNIDTANPEANDPADLARFYAAALEAASTVH